MDSLNTHKKILIPMDQKAIKSITNETNPEKDLTLTEIRDKIKELNTAVKDVCIYPY